jgi:hypothetical protein
MGTKDLLLRYRSNGDRGVAWHEPMWLLIRECQTQLRNVIGFKSCIFNPSLLSSAINPLPYHTVITINHSLDVHNKSGTTEQGTERNGSGSLGSTLSRGLGRQTGGASLGTRGNTRSEGNVANGAGAREGSLLSACSRVGGSRGLVGVEDAVNDVKNTVGDEDIRNNDLRLVDIDCSVIDGNVEILAIGSSECTVLECAAVAKSVVDDVVLENILEISLASVGKDRANVGKGAVAGNKDGDVPLTGEVGQELRFCEGTSSGGQVGSNGSIRDVLGDGKNTVDDVNDAAGEVKILESQSGGSML